VNADILPHYECVFWMREKPYYKAHLHFIITYPEDADGWALVVGTTTKTRGAIGSFVLHPGDHPALKDDSFLSYASLQLANMEKLARSYREIPKLVWSERKASAVLIVQIQQVLIDSNMLESRYVELIAVARQRFAG